MIDWSACPRVEEIPAPNPETFHRDVKLRERPVVMRGLVAHWPAAVAGAASDEALCQYLTRAAQPRPIEFFYAAPETGGRIGYRPDFSGFNFERRTASVADLVAELLRLRDHPAPPSLYAGALRMKESFPGFSADNPDPLIDTSTAQLNSVWIGNRVTIAAHWDLARNLICVIGGRRRYILMPPEQVRNLYVGPIETTPAGQPMSLVNFHAPDFAAHPLFKDAAQTAQIAELGSGDALFLPSLWWHHAETLSPVGAMVNCWWRDTPGWMTTPLTTMMHALLTIRDLPEAERAAWRAFFDHYVFSAESDGMEHVPEHARGVLGPMTPAKAAQLRAMIAQRIS